jgi:tetratricopeptide (TPR) repeat protein
VDLSNLKKWEEAIEADNESLETYKALAQEDPDEYDPCVAEGLDYLADHLSDSGRLQEALDVRKQGVVIARANFAKDPAANLSDLAPALYNLGEDYANLELYTEAIQADKEALQLYRDLEKVKPTTHSPNVMDAVENCGLHLKNLQRYEEAIPYFREQVDLTRLLFAKNPASHREHLAEALFHLTDDAKYLELWDESIAAAEESLALYRILAEDHPKKYLGDVIEGLESLALPLSRAGRRQEALVHWREEISCLRTALANEESDEDRSHLANVLHNLADDAAAEQLFEECIKAEGESVAIYRELAKDDPKAYNSKVIVGLCFVARHLFKAQHLTDADTAAKEVLAYTGIISPSSPSTTRDHFVGVLRECAALLEDNFTPVADELRAKAAKISAPGGKDGNNREGDGNNGS